MKELSHMRRAILQYVTTFSRENGYPPTVREICVAVGLRSPSTVHAHLKILQQGGYLEKDANKTRAITVKGEHNFGGVPLLGTVAAGQPILAEEQVVGYVPFDGRDNGTHFALSVQGDSMIDAGILDGDTIIVRQQNTARNGQIVVALLEDEATVKRLHKQGDEVWLLPENAAYEPIDGRFCTILGLVVAVYRTLAP